MTSKDVAEWMAYASIEPWGEERADRRQAITSYILAQAYGKRGRSYKVEDFMTVPPIATRARMEMGEMKAILKGLAKKGK